MKKWKIESIEICPECGSEFTGKYCICDYELIVIEKMLILRNLNET